MNKLIHFNNTGTARFVTFSCYHNYNLLKSDSARIIFVNHLDRLREKYSCKLYGYVIMTNQVQIVILPPQDIQLSRIIGVLKSMTAREIIDLWQRKGLKVFDKLKIHKDSKERYTLNAPLGVRHPEWRWSGYRWYNGVNDTLIDIDRLEQ